MPLQLQLEETVTNTSKTQELEKEVKEKKFLIDKLRHESMRSDLMPWLSLSLG